MDKAKSSFLAGSVAKASGVLGNNAGPDQNLPIRESDNIGRSGIIEKGPVHSGDRPVTNNCRLNLLKTSQGRSTRSDRAEACRQGALRH